MDPEEEKGTGAENSSEHANNGAVLMDFTSSFKKVTPGGATKPWLVRSQASQPPRPPSSSKDSTAASNATISEVKHDKDEADDEEGLPTLTEMLTGDEGPQPQELQEPQRNENSAVEAPMVIASDAVDFSTEAKMELGSLNSRLDQLGYSKLDLDEPESIVNVIQKLLSDARVANETISSYEATVHRASSDLKRLQSENEGLTAQVQCLKMDSAAITNQLSVTTSKAKKEKQASEAWIKELQVTIAKMEGQQKGWQASLNRKETDYEKLQKRMQTMQAQRDRSIKRTMEMEYPPTHLQAWAEDESTGNEEGDGAFALQQAAENAAMRKNQLLTAENTQLRDSIASLRSLIASKLRPSSNGKGSSSDSIAQDKAASQRGENDAQAENMEVALLALSEETSNLPAHKLAQYIEDMRTKVEKLTGEWDSPSATSSGNAETTDKEVLQQHLDEAKQVIVEQDQLLRNLLFQPTPDSSSFDDADEESAQVSRAEKHAALKTPTKKGPNTALHSMTPATPEISGSSILENLPGLVATPATKELLRAALD